MEENKILAYVRGNDVLFIVTVTTPERDEYGRPVYGDDELQLVPVDFTGWDDYSLRVVKQGVTRTIVAESSQLVEGEDGKIVVDVPYTAQCGTYSLELVGRQNGRHERSYEIMMFAIVESNDKANLIYEIIDGYKSADLDITVQMVSSALVYGENAYQMWKHLPGNEDKTLQDYIDEVLDLTTITENARHPDYVGEDNYVYRWDTETQSYYNTDIYVKGERGEKGDKGDKGDTGATGATGAQGIQGEQGEKGDPFTYSDFTAEQLAALRGPQGDKGDKGDPMRYEDLSPAQIESLRGPKGDDGADGQDGQDGQDGVSPHIDSTSGNWYVGSTDTGVHAQGPQGIQGQQGPQGVPGQDGRDGQDGHGVPTGGVTGQVLKKKSNTDYDTEWGEGGGGGGAAAYTPTLSSVPTSSTTTYEKDGVTVNFEIGQFARVANASSSSGYDLYQLYDITGGIAKWEKVENIHADHEDVQIVVTTSVTGVSVSGLVINAYFNGSSSVSATATTDANGMAAIQVPNGYSYRLVFPDIEGCKSIEPVVHTASVNQRSVEVEYKAVPQDEGEAVTVVVQKKTGDTYSKVEGEVVTVTVDNTSTTYTTDTQGKVVFNVPYGKQYTVSAAQINGWYIPQNAYTLEFVAEQSMRNVLYNFRKIESGVFVVCGNGAEYALVDFEAARAQGVVQNSDAKLIAIKTAALIAAGGTFALDIDHLRDRSYGSNQKWCDSNVQFNSIPQNGNSASANYYYDGLTSSRLIQQEGDERGLPTAAVDQALGMSRKIAEGTANERTLPGFLGSVGQWAQLWANVAEVDDILVSVRPSGQYLLSTLTTNKWTSTQHNANGAWTWSSSANANGKYSCSAVVPFFAF